ncbi:MAG: hypothetical protein NZ772_12495 [Cyanobacteria bacterium]|nr:hypothetical protein [Cyanobacteriota bacterium]MDW8202171.1 hypothetical protein [Cyanobacteriota bacterium SKYGB_h_bin112]
MMGILYANTLGKANTGELTELTCQRVETYVNCQLTREDVQGNQTMNQTIRRVQKATVLTVPTTRRVCTGTGENRRCSDKPYTLCISRIVANNVPVEIPLSEFKAGTTDPTCQAENSITYAIASLVKGDLTVKVWTDDTRTGDMKAEFWGIASCILAGAGLFALVLIAQVRQDIWLFDRQQQKIRHTVRYLWRQQETAYPWKDAIGLEYTSGGTVKLWFRQGQKLWGRAVPVMENSSSELVAQIEPYLNHELRIEKFGGLTIERTPTRLTIHSTNPPKQHYVIDLDVGTINYSWEENTPDPSSAINHQGALRIAGKVHSNPSLPIRQVNSVQFVTKYDDEGDRMYSFNLKLVDDTTEPLSDFTYGYTDVPRIANRIATFLQVPLNKVELREK